MSKVETGAFGVGFIPKCVFRGLRDIVVQGRRGKAWVSIVKDYATGVIERFLGFDGRFVGHKDPQDRRDEQPETNRSPDF